MNDERPVAHLYLPQSKYNLIIQESSICSSSMPWVHFTSSNVCPWIPLKGEVDNIFDDFHISDCLYSSVGERVCGKLYEERSYWTVPARSLFPMWNSISNLRHIILNMIFQRIQSDHWSNVDQQKSTSARWEDI